MTHYATLGVEPTATQDQIDAAYTELSDWLSSAEGVDPLMYELVQEAYGELSIPTRRAAYDLALIDEAAEPTMLPPPEPVQAPGGTRPALGLQALLDVVGWAGVGGLLFAAGLLGWLTFQLTGTGGGASFVFFVGGAVLVFLLLRIASRRKG